MLYFFNRFYDIHLMSKRLLKSTFYTNQKMKTKSAIIQGCNARKVISEVYTSFVLQCTVFGR